MARNSRRGFLKAASATAAALAVSKGIPAWGAKTSSSSPVRVWATFRDRRYESVQTLAWKPVTSVAADAIALDPGIGFGKTTAHNLSLLRHLGDLVEAGAGAGCTGVLLGTSRKRFLGVLAAAPGSEVPAPVADRAEGSLATEAAALVAGVGMLRVHDVAATVQMARLYGPAA